MLSNLEKLYLCAVLMFLVLGISICVCGRLEGGSLLESVALPEDPSLVLSSLIWPLIWPCNSRSDAVFWPLWVLQSYVLLLPHIHVHVIKNKINLKKMPVWVIVSTHLGAFLAFILGVLFSVLLAFRDSFWFHEAASTGPTPIGVLFFFLMFESRPSVPLQDHQHFLCPPLN